MNTKQARFWQVMIVLLVPFVLVLGSVRLLATDAYLAFEYGKRSFPADPYGFEPEERFTHARDNLVYVRSRQPLEVLAAQTHRGSPLYNVRELSHMRDVQIVFQAAHNVWLVSLGLAAMGGMLLSRQPATRPRFFQAVRYGGGLTAILVFLAGLLAVAAWQSWFQTFHQVFFQAGTWVFNNNDTLIRLFPEKFWFDAALTVTGASLVSGGLLYIAAARKPALLVLERLAHR